MGEIDFAGIYTLAGTALGGGIAYVTARIGHRWEDVRRDVRKLSRQVAAYHRLEALYAEALGEASPDGKKAMTIKKEMRDRVEGELERPKMTSRRAKELEEKWS